MRKRAKSVRGIASDDCNEFWGFSNIKFHRLYRRSGDQASSLYDDGVTNGMSLRYYIDTGAI